ncbi:MAG: diheme cytochrome c [Gammaproteobacteria bacterium]|nr:diheme cytochrome c [Gammaproteobacteria bacterium]MDH3450221.1 diheme cytochrome c [Gammaproteobacteria bacterium]
MQVKIRMIMGAALLGTIVAFSLYGVGRNLASASNNGFESDSYYEDHDDDEARKYRSSAAQDPIYVEECGSCHMAYPGELLPAGSWRKIMSGLDDHFGENAELDPDTRQSVEDYLVHVSKAGGYRKLQRNLGGQTPLRITELPYFVHEHDEIPRRLIEGNDRVGSLSQCNACHQGAEKGHFDEDDVVIAGFGRWDD